ncbi:MAG TPA: hypothetical protein PK543_00250 [Candidatus Saccharibacteria bacterium]|nr:hypothetical protein [Candidatus Saccharibacteria bacterium]
MNKRMLIIVGAILVLVLVAVVIFAYLKTPNSKISSYDECVAAGNPVMLSYPPQCSANGKTYVQDAPPSTIPN